MVAPRVPGRLRREPRLIAHNRTTNNAVVSAVAVLIAIISVHGAIKCYPGQERRRVKPKDLPRGWSFEKSNRMFNDFEFSKAYRMDRHSFERLLFLAHDRLQQADCMARRAGREPVSPRARLGILLRLMAGDSAYSCMSVFEVGRSTVYHIFRETRKALNEELCLPGLPDSYDALKKLADDFQTSRYPWNPLPGCVGALDGIAIKIRKPSRDEHPATFYCRKGYYAIPVQAAVDSNYRFLCFSAVCRGSTHDSLAHAVSSLGRYLQTGALQGEFWIAGDEAYVCSISLITPIAASQATDVEDAFNFFHSSLRMHVEQSFGMLVSKFKLLKRLEYGVNDSAQIIGLAMKLHNFCLENKDSARLAVPRTVEELHEERRVKEASSKWYEIGKQYHKQIVNRRGSRQTRKRKELVEIIASGGYRRPPARPMSVPQDLLQDLQQ